IAVRNPKAAAYAIDRIARARTTNDRTLLLVSARSFVSMPRVTCTCAARSPRMLGKAAPAFRSGHAHIIDWNASRSVRPDARQCRLRRGLRRRSCWLLVGASLRWNCLPFPCGLRRNAGTGAGNVAARLTLGRRRKQGERVRAPIEPSTLTIRAWVPA